jgi:hypothetical protein
MTFEEPPEEELLKNNTSAIDHHGESMLDVEEVL